MLVEVVLDLLVGDVNAELLERVLREILEAEDVEQTDGQGLVVMRAVEAQQTVNLVDHPVEEPTVQTLGHGVACRAGLDDSVVAGNGLASGHHGVGG